MFQLSETEEKGGKNPVRIQSNNKEKAEHREIQMWERERGRDVRKKAEGWKDDQRASQYEQNS